MSKVRISFILFLFSGSLIAQFRFQPKFDVPVNANGSRLERAWEGGLNSAQFQTLDLNGDSVQDLVIFHRISRDITTYLRMNEGYERSPQFDHVFPEDTRSLLLLKDYDCDGKKDLFTSTSLGIKVYRNTSSADGISWALAKNFLTFDAGANIQMAPTDIPGIADVNGDGALDILTFRFGNANSIDLYLNTGSCGSLDFTRSERRWGNFEECGCNDFVFGQACPTSNASLSPNEQNQPESTAHIGGKTILLFDADNDGDQDLITSDETCETLYFMENEGDMINARMTRIQGFPSTDPVGFPFFPSAFMEDVDADGLLDLLISTNADENIGNQIELSAHVNVFQNVGNDLVPTYQNSQPFLQNEMLDFGEYAYPEFVDIDQDGDQDLIIGNKGLIEYSGFYAKLVLLENVGNLVSPSFEITDVNFLDLLAEEFTFIKPRFVDLDNDGDLDLSYQATDAFGNTNVFFRENTGNQSFAPPITLPINASANDHPFWYDIDGDQDPDLLLGKQFGSLSLFINEGNFTFSPEQRAFAGFIDDFERLNLNVLVFDIDGNGIDDLLTTDLSGELRAYRGPIDLDFLATNPISSIYFDNERTRSSSFGIQHAMTSADLLGAGLPTLVLGSIKGGLLMLDNISENNGELNTIILRVRPNPAVTQVEVLTNANGVLEVINMHGQKVVENLNITPGNELTLMTNPLASGIYIFRVISEQGQTRSTKVIIY